MRKLLFAISFYLTFSIAGKAQTTFECKNSFYLSQHQLDSVNGITNMHKLTWENNVLDIQKIAEYKTIANGIALNPFDGLIYGFNVFSQEIVRLYPNGDFDNLGKPAGLFDFKLNFSGAAFDDLGRYLLTGYNQFIATIDVSCDTAILIQHVERNTNDEFSLSFFSDIAFHPENDLLYGYDSRTNRLATINPNTGFVNHIGIINDQPNIGAIFFDENSNLFGYEANEFYSINVKTGEVSLAAIGIDTDARDGCSCLTIVPNKKRFAINTTFDACGASAIISTSGFRSKFDVEYIWSHNGKPLEQAHESQLNIEQNGIYEVSIQVNNYCGAAIHSERLEVSVEFPEPFLFESIEVADACCSGTNGSILAYIDPSHDQPLIQLNGMSMASPTFEQLSEGRYQLSAESSTGCKIDTAIEIKNSLCDLYVPNAFSPNNDGINDELKILSQRKAKFSVVNYQIFDRWGNKLYDAPIFESNSDLFWWNGISNARELNIGVFILVYTIQWPNGRLESGHQSVTLIN